MPPRKRLEKNDRNVAPPAPERSTSKLKCAKYETNSGKVLSQVFLSSFALSSVR